MPDITPDQQIARDAIRAVISIAEAADANAGALQEAAHVLRRMFTSDDGGFIVGNPMLMNALRGDPISTPCCGDCDHAPDEAEDDEAPEEPAEEEPSGPRRYTSAMRPDGDISGTAELPIERPLDVVRSDAGFTGGPVWVGGPGAYEGPHCYWTEADRGLTHAMLMDACTGLSLEGRREAHVRAGAAGQTVTALYEALLAQKRVEMAAYKSSFGPETTLRINITETPDETGLYFATSPDLRGLVVAKTSLDALWRAIPGAIRDLRAAADAPFDLATDLNWFPGDDGLEPRSLLDAVEALEGTPPTTGPADMGDIPHEAELVEEINARFGPHDSASVAAQEAAEAPNLAALSTPAVVSEAASPASCAAPDTNLDSAYGADLDRIALEQFGVKRRPNEPDTSFRAFLRARDRADDLKAGAWPGISGSQAVELRGPLFPPPVGHVVAGTNESVND